jgi:hypothetical protein
MNAVKEEKCWFFSAPLWPYCIMMMMSLPVAAKMPAFSHPGIFRCGDFITAP